MAAAYKSFRAQQAPAEPAMGNAGSSGRESSQAAERRRQEQPDEDAAAASARRRTVRARRCAPWPWPETGCRHTPSPPPCPMQASGGSSNGYPGASQVAAISAQRPVLAQVQAQLLEGMRPEHGYGYGVGPRQGQVAAWPAVQKTVTIRNEVNLKKPTLRLVPHASDPSKLQLEFSFDASASCHISVYYAASENKGGDGSITGYTALHVDNLPPKEARGKGLAQSYRVPAAHALDVSRYSLEQLTWAPPRDSAPQPGAARRPASDTPERYPVIIAMEAISTQTGAARSQTTFATLERLRVEDVEGEAPAAASWAIRAIKQKIQVGSSSYELQEIYGIDQARTRSVGSTGSSNGTGAADDDDDACGGSECVICMSEAKDTTVLPCRHMCMCSGCARVLRVQSNRCPICRQMIDSLLQIKVSKPTQNQPGAATTEEAPASVPHAATKVPEPAGTAA